MAYEEVLTKINEIAEELDDIDEEEVDEEKLQHILQRLDSKLYSFIEERVHLINEEEREIIMSSINDFPELESVELFKIFYDPIAKLFSDNPYEGEEDEEEGEETVVQVINNQGGEPANAGKQANVGQPANAIPVQMPLLPGQVNEEQKGGKKRKSRKSKKHRKTRKSRKTKKSKKSKKSRKGSKGRKSLKRK